MRVAAVVYASKQRGRDRQRARYVVEASRRIVRREKRVYVHLEIEQVANSVGVFGAIQAMQHDGTGIRMLGCFAVDFSLQPVA